MSRRCLASLLLALSAASGTSGAQPVATRLPAPLAGAGRVLFLGDSITYAGTYVEYVEAAARLRDPAWPADVLALGLPSETVSGLSEPGHADGRFPRPDLHERLGRVLEGVRPGLIVACYGMNDGIYQPWSEERFARFRDAVARLHARALAAGAGIVHLTPPVFDARAIPERVSATGRDGYAKPYSGYDDVLARYGEWLLARRAEGWSVVDVHGPMRAELGARRAADASFTFAKDGVHPDRLGHAVIARAILSAWGFPDGEAEAPLRWAAEPPSELLQLVSERRKLLSDAWLTATGHSRPGMARGAPLDAAQSRAAEIDARIRALLQRR